MESHREVVNLFVDAVNRRSPEGFAAIESEQYLEAAVQPWVHSRSGCLDQSGRRKFGAKSRTAPRSKHVQSPVTAMQWGALAGAPTMMI